MRVPALFVAAALAAFGCSGEATPDIGRAVDAPVISGDARTGGALVLDRDRFEAWAADADNNALHRVALDTHAITSFDVEGSPSAILLLKPGLLAVAIRDASRVDLLEVGERSIERIASTFVPTDPVGLARSTRGEILVTSAMGHAVTGLDEATLATRWTVDVAREPRAVVPLPKGDRAFVTHLVGSAVSVLEFPSIEGRGSENKNGAPYVRRVEGLGGTYRNRVDHAIGAGTLHPKAALAYTAVLSDSGGRLFVPHVIEQSGAEGTRVIPGAYGGVPVDEETAFSSVAVFSTRSMRPIVETIGIAPDQAVNRATYVGDPDIPFAVAPSASPSKQARAAAVLGDRATREGGVATHVDRLFVASFGTNEIVELDGRAIDPSMSVVRKTTVCEGPIGLAIDAPSRSAIAFCQLSHELAIMPVDGGAVTRITLDADPLPPEIAAGRRLFYTERDRRITRDGRACGGCHPEGRDDGLVWKLGAGPRQTPMLLGRLGRGPYGWLAKHDVLEDNMRETMSRLGGTGLSAKDLHHLAAFVQKGLFIPARSPADPKPDPAIVARGRAIFTSAEVGCSSCHRLDHEASDRVVHDVGSQSRTDQSASFRTPPLVFVGASAPYFHDGRYPTLEALVDNNLDRMGQTSVLTKDDKRALITFLRTL